MDSADRSALELLRVETSGKLDRLNDKVDVLSRELARFTDDHEKRVRSLERWKFTEFFKSVVIESISSMLTT